MERLPRAPRNTYLLITAISGFIALAALVNITPPDSVWVISLFVLLFSVSSGLLTQYLFRRPRQSLLVSCGIAVFLTIRTFGLKNPLYTVLLAATVIAVEIYWKRR